MTPKKFLQTVKNTPLAPGYSFLGNELFYRDHCRKVLVKAVLGNNAYGTDEGLIEFDLAEHSLEKMIDEARTLSLFSSSRLIIGVNAEAALPRKLTGALPDSDALVRYFQNPTPGVVLLFESASYDWSDRDDQRRLERLIKFYSAVPQVVKFQRFTPEDALTAARILVRRLNLSIESAALAELVEMLGSDMARLANDLEKLALYAGDEQEITHTEIELLVPEARQCRAFEFSDTLARKDRKHALDVLDTLSHSGEYWPMQISLLAGLFRQALAAKEERVCSVQDVMRIFNKHGIRMWPARARQVMEIARQFSQAELERAVGSMFEADRDLRQARPDDRVVMEQLVVNMTA